MTAIFAVDKFSPFQAKCGYLCDLIKGKGQLRQACQGIWSITPWSAYNYRAYKYCCHCSSYQDSHICWKSTQFWIEKSLPHSINGIANWIESADIAQPVGKKGYSGESSWVVSGAQWQAVLPYRIQIRATVLCKWLYVAVSKDLADGLVIASQGPTLFEHPCWPLRSWNYEEVAYQKANYAEHFTE